jgi:hypothetical protein
MKTNKKMYKVTKDFPYRWSNAIQVKKGSIIIEIGPYGFVNQTYGAEIPFKMDNYCFKSVDSEFREEVSDYDLLKISNHLLKEKKHNVFSTKEFVEDELRNRGYSYNEEKKRWYK